MDTIHITVDAPEYCLFYQHDVWWLCLEKGEWAGWMQAIGALIAIVFTIFQIWWNKHQEMKNQTEKKEVVNAAISDYEMRYGKEVYGLVWQLRNIGQASGMFLRDPQHAALLEIHELTRAINLQDLPDSKSVQRILNILKNIKEVRRIYMRTGNTIKGPLDYLTTEEMESLARQLSPYIQEAKKIPGVDD